MGKDGSGGVFRNGKKELKSTLVEVLGGSPGLAAGRAVG